MSNTYIAYVGIAKSYGKKALPPHKIARQKGCNFLISFRRF